MKKLKVEEVFFLLAILFTLASCDCTYQYDVLVKNETGVPVEVKYKTTQDVRGEVEETVTVANGKLKRIISTKNINTGEGCTGIEKKHCGYVAEYIKAYMGEKESKNTWCSENVELNNVDVQQGEFILTYGAGDF